MKLWKGAILAFILISAAFSFLLTRTMLSAGPTNPRASAPSHNSSAALSSSLPSSSSSPRVTGLRRVARSTDGMGSLLSEFSYLFQSFTEGELQRVIRMLVERKARRSGTMEIRRTKRARRGLGGKNSCKLHKTELMVSDLGLGYDSNEIVRFSYCSGKCIDRRRNYDLVMAHMLLNEPTSQKGKASRAEIAKRDCTRYSPCCRPTKYDETIVFFGNNDKFDFIQNVSAIECGCV